MESNNDRDKAERIVSKYVLAIKVDNVLLGLLIYAAIKLLEHLLNFSAPTEYYVMLMAGLIILRPPATLTKRYFKIVVKKTNKGDNIDDGKEGTQF